MLLKHGYITTARKLNHINIHCIKHLFYAWDFTWNFVCIIKVVKYGPFGHYNSHHDTETHERTDVPCCHHTNINIVQQHGKCRICRYRSPFLYSTGHMSCISHYSIRFALIDNGDIAIWQSHVGLNINSNNFDKCSCYKAPKSAKTSIWII